MRLFFDAAGDVVGLEVLGWSQRAETPSEVRVIVHPAPAEEPLPDDHPLARALAGGTSVTTDQHHRPLHDGTPLLSLSEAAAKVGREHSWLSRQMASGRLRAVKIGRAWWTAPEWVGAYRRGRPERRGSQGRRTGAPPVPLVDAQQGTSYTGAEGAGRAGPLEQPGAGGA